nr:syncoilin-like isoform X2 [Doryrhamphus excisus]
MEIDISVDNGKHMESTFVGDIRQNSNADADMDNNMKGSDMESLGEIFEQCIEQVSRLEMERDVLIKELQFLHEPLMRVVEHLRGKLVEKWGLVTLAQMDYMVVSQEVQQVKRKLFITARDCIQSQVTLAEQEYQVAQAALTKEELKAHVQSLTEELFQLQDAHQNQLNILKDHAKKPSRPRAMSDVSQCRQASVRLQRRLSINMKELEGWYEPRLVSLLKRRQFGEKALRMSKEQAVGLRAQVGSLKEEAQRLEEKRYSMEQRISLMELERETMITQHKELEEELKETVKKLVLEFDIQKRHTRDLQALTNDILEKLAQIRDDEPSEAPDKEHPQDSSSQST